MTVLQHRTDSFHAVSLCIHDYQAAQSSAVAAVAAAVRDYHAAPRSGTSGTLARYLLIAC
jgi:hypothetical protein